MSDIIEHMNERAAEAVGPDLAADLAAVLPDLPRLEIGEAGRHRLVEVAWPPSGSRAGPLRSRPRRPSRSSTSSRPRRERSPSGSDATPSSERHGRPPCPSPSPSASRIAAADRRLALAVGLADQPQLAEALRVGRVDEAQARTIHEQTLSLPAEPARPVWSTVAARPSPPAGRTVWSVPPHTAAPDPGRRSRRGVPGLVRDQTADDPPRGARWTTTPPPSSGPVPWCCTARTSSWPPTYASLDATARAARQAGAPETLDQLRFDLAVGALTGGAYGT